MSDPNAILLPIHQALTSDMLLGLKPSAPKSRSYRISCAPMNGSVFQGNGQMIFELPTGRRGTWMDQSQSYLKFSVQCTAAAACAAGAATGGIYVENTAYSFIQRLDIYNSSNLLETINEYGQLANFLIDTSLTQSDKAGLSTLIGSNPNDNIQSSIPVGTAGAWPTNAITPVVSVEVQRAGDRSGMSMAAVVPAGAGYTLAIPYTFCLPLVSGVVGINSSKMLPVGKLNAPIRCEFYLAGNDDAVYYGTGGAGCTWYIVNAEFDVCYVELQDDSLDAPLAPGEQEYISTTTYRQASTIMPVATSGEFTQLVPFRCASLCAIYARFRPYGSNVQGANATAAYRKSCSVNPNLASLYWRIGSSIYPNKPIYLVNGTTVGTGAEGFAELLKSFHALSSTIGNTTLNYGQYNVAQNAVQGWAANVGIAINNATALGNHYNAFAVGLELQSFSNRSDTILSGISTLNSQVYFTGTTYAPTILASTIDFFGNMDMILVLQDGILAAKF